ncbi:MAG: cphA [Modestobacter sp.]|nr:cphA [Modestobacter sp.]
MMRIDHVRRLRGPNRYLPQPVTIATLDLEELAGHETTDHPRFDRCLLELLPGLADHHCAAGAPGGLLDKMARGTYFGHVFEHVVLELSHLIGREVYFGRTIWAGTPGWFDVLLECPVDEVPSTGVCEDLLELGRRIVTAAVAGAPTDVATELGPIASRYEQSQLGVSTAELARAARERAIPVRRLTDTSLLQLGYGCHRRLLWSAMTDRTSATGVDIASDKLLTKQLLAAAGVAVPDGILASSADETGAAYQDLGPPVVVKPLRGRHGNNVFVEVCSEAEARADYAVAGGDGAPVLVETYAEGRDYRVLIVGGRLVAAAELTAPCVTGDGFSDIAALVDRVNRDPRRGEGHDRPLTKMALDDTVVAHLAGQGRSPATVPAAGEVVVLRHNANLSTGGTSRDITDLVHPDITAMCLRVAESVGLDICGVDLRLPDISAPFVPGHHHGGVIEVNASPGLRMHLHPNEGPVRDVAGAIIDSLYPAGAPSRIPVVAVTGTNGKTTTVRMISHILRRAGLRTGMATTDGVFVGDRLVYQADASGPRSAEMVLGDPSVEAAVLETARGGIVRRGLGYDLADVAVVTNVTQDHVGSDGLRTIDDLVQVKSLVAETIAIGGQLVLNADDRNSIGMAGRPAVRDRDPVIRLFSLAPDNPAVEHHVRQGGTAYVMDAGWLVEIDAGRRSPLIDVEQLPCAFAGEADFLVANMLAAVAACRALGVREVDVRLALSSFDPGRDNPGRADVHWLGSIPCVVDYAHNPAALDAVGRLIERHWHRPAVAVLTLPGDRRDDLVKESAEAVARSFDRVVVYEDADLRGRRSGEMTGLVTSALTGARPGIRCMPAGTLEDAVTAAVRLAAPSDPILLVYEKLHPVTALLEGILQGIGASPADAGSLRTRCRQATRGGDPPPA